MIRGLKRTRLAVWPTLWCTAVFCLLAPLLEARTVVVPAGRIEARTAEAPEGRWEYTYNAGGLKQTVEDTVNGVVSTYEYDAQGRQTATRQDGELRQATEYRDGPGGTRERVVTDAEGNRSIERTDAAGRVVASVFEGVAGSRRETLYSYDEHGRQTRVVSPRGLVTDTFYDAAGREVETRSTAQGRTVGERRGYDPAGRTLWTQTQLQQDAGIYTVYEYNFSVSGDDPAYGQRIGVYYEVPSGDLPSFDAAVYKNGTGHWEEYTYDAEGRQQSVIRPVALSPDATVTAIREFIREHPIFVSISTFAAIIGMIGALYPRVRGRSILNQREKDILFNKEIRSWFEEAGNAFSVSPTLLASFALAEVIETRDNNSVEAFIESYLPHGKSVGLLQIRLDESRQHGYIADNPLLQKHGVSGRLTEDLLLEDRWNIYVGAMKLRDIADRFSVEAPERIIEHLNKNGIDATMYLMHGENWKYNQGSVLAISQAWNHNHFRQVDLGPSPDPFTGIVYQQYERLRNEWGTKW